MRTTPPALRPILRSQVQGEVLARLYLHPDEEHSLAELAELTATSPQSIQHEVSRLVKAGLLRDRRLGRSRLIRANPDSMLARPLTDLLMVTYGPVPVLESELGPIKGIEQAFVFGSWAARHQGISGAIPNDVDVMVVGRADLDALDDAADRAQKVLRRPVNIRRVSPSAWQSSSDPFFTQVREQPLVQLRLESSVQP